jgi:diguanylate cyclase (GGDEF)-like protein
VLLILVAAPLPTLVLARLSWLASVLSCAGTLTAARDTARRLRVGAAPRRFWWAVCGYALATGAGYLIQLLTARGEGHLEPGASTLALTGLGVGCMVVVMATYPVKIRSRRARFCFWLDMATVMVGAAAFGWYMAAPSGGDVQTGLLAVLSGPVIMLLGVFAVAKLLVSGRPPFTTWTGLIGAGGGMTGGLLAVFGAALLAGDRDNWYFALSALGDALMMIGASVQRLQVDADPDALDRPHRRPYSTLPYIAIAGTFALLSIALSGQGLDGGTWALLGGAVISIALVVVRQLAAFSDNARLLGELDIKVRELHETDAILRAALAERDTLAVRLHDMAFQDSLTGLANRALFHDRLTAALARARRHNTQVVVMLLDLDDFKPINDRLGHAAGDAVLCEIAGRLRRCLRETDTIARLGGDEFAIVLDDPVPDSVAMVAERIVAVVREPCQFSGTSVSVGVSVGVAAAAGGWSDVDHLLHEADDAMYMAKARGKNSYEMAPAQTEINGQKGMSNDLVILRGERSI